jgi:hypothetical protein
VSIEGLWCYLFSPAYEQTRCLLDVYYISSACIQGWGILERCCVCVKCEVCSVFEVLIFNNTRRKASTVFEVSQVMFQEKFSLICNSLCFFDCVVCGEICQGVHNIIPYHTMSSIQFCLKLSSHHIKLPTRCPRQLTSVCIIYWQPRAGLGCLAINYWNSLVLYLAISQTNAVMQSSCTYYILLHSL